MDRTLRVVSWAGQVANLSHKAGKLPHACLLAAVLSGLVVLQQAARAAPNDREAGGVTQAAQGPELGNPLRPMKRLPPIAEPPETPPAETAPRAAWPSIARLPKVEAPPPETAAPAATPRKISAPAAIPLKAAEPPKERSEQLERVARQADEQTRHGFDLAGRGAYFAARSELIGACD